ncbi:hypothetical protein LHYA1_G003265 [Lachnellula hyalina]|uniref:Uncharacterized protein n=1 Tax=Lachnellula hyalina TaxID=1316788 RepID=A0A8H8R621_9HELO|nr:uncharacterized protein LHYA1_G003265 [Lachnellula hyalina]TVY28281.1 hypothetical protein LHYA1_G003265 [Lachnellula hyalina]
MDEENEIFITSRSRAPSIINVKSENVRVFVQLPDLIQEAAVSTEFSSPNLRIKRVHNNRVIGPYFMKQPMFYVASRTDSGIDLPDLDVKDEKILAKYGLDLTANFADIKAYGAEAFFQKKNASNGSNYSLCACATGYIWISVRTLYESTNRKEFSDVEVQIGTFALKAKAITTMEIPLQYMYSGRDDPLDGQLALLCSIVLGKYLRLRMIGKQYESAAETAIKESRRQLSPLRIVDPGRFGDFESFLTQICENAPLPPTSDVSLISRSMITGRWKIWRERSILRRRYFLPHRVVQCFRQSQHDSIDLLSGCFQALTPEKSNSRPPIITPLT